MKPKLFWMPYGFNKPNFNYDPTIEINFVLQQGLAKENEKK